jgi:predicted SAM-dependent methyltransferase
MKDICWYQKECIDSMNKFEDECIKNQDIQPHYASFLELLDLCGYGKLLDIGTGTARISQFCKRFDFVGADLPHIISGCAMRNYPKYKYQSIDIIEDNLAWIREYDVIVLNGVIDVMQNGLYILERILTHSRRYVLIHRQEITESGKTYSKINPSYNSNTFHSIINRNDFNQLLEKMGFEIVKENSPGFSNWENGGSSFLLKNKVKDMSKYDSHPLRQLKNRIQQANPCKVVIGGGDVIHDKDWIVTNIEELDVENEDDFEFLFGEKQADNFLSSHVHEHLNNPTKANENLYKYLKIGGKLRIAVPDGNHPSEDYINQVKPNGIGAGADDHKHLWDYETLLDSCVNAGFKSEGIEYWFDGKFIKKDWSISDGFVGRSAEYDERNINGELNYTSLIIDCIK